MKKVGKKICIYTIVMVLFSILVMVIYGAFFKIDPIKLAKANASEKGNCYFVDTTNENATIKVSSGTRENPYSLDGIHNDTKPFTLVIFKTTLNGITEPSYVATIDNTKYEGVLELNPIDNTYVCDLGVQTYNTSKIDITIKVNEYEFTFAPTNLSATFGITFEEALDLGLKEMYGVVSNLTEGNKFNGETYVKIISDPASNLNMYYYYVAVVDNAGNIYSVVLDTASGKKLSK